MVKSDEKSPCFSPVFPGFPSGKSPWLSGSRGAFQGGPLRGRAPAAVGGAAAPSTGCVEAACEMPSYGEDGFFPQQQNFAMESLAQIRSGAIRCSFNTRFRARFRRVLVQIPREVPQGYGADTWLGEVPEVSGAAT